jgi:hypothetical protein
MTFTLSNPCICVQATPKDKKAELLIRARVDEVCLAYSTTEQYFRHFIIPSKDSLRCVCIFPGKLWNPRSTSFWEPWDVLYLDVDEQFSFSCSWKFMSSDGLLRLVSWNKILTQVMWEVMNKLNQIIPPFVRIDRIRMSYYYYWTSKSIFSQITSWLLLPQSPNPCDC